jgi:hypothetical protein
VAGSACFRSQADWGASIATISRNARVRLGPTIIPYLTDASHALFSKVSPARGNEGGMPSDVETPTPKGLVRRLKHLLHGEREMLTLEDPSSQTSFSVMRESPAAAALAVATFLYLVGVTLAMLWELVDVWSGQLRLVEWLGFSPALCSSSPTFRQMAFVAIGGCLGSALSGLRSLTFWHCTHRAFEPRFFWRYATSPLCGAALALLVQILIRAGTAILGGDDGGGMAGSRRTMTSFAVGMLSGYGTEQVTRWLDDHVKRLFRPTGEPVVRRITPPRREDPVDGNGGR